MYRGGRCQEGGVPRAQEVPGGTQEALPGPTYPGPYLPGRTRTQGRTQAVPGPREVPRKVPQEVPRTLNTSRIRVKYGLIRVKYSLN